MSEDFFAWLEADQANGGMADAIEKTDKLAPRMSAQDGLRLLREKLLESGLGILGATMAAADFDFDPEQKDPPPEWVEQFGMEEAKRRYRVACYALLPKKDAPVFLEMTQKTVVALVSREAKDPSEVHNHLHVNMVSMPVPQPRPLQKKQIVEAKDES